MLSYKFVSHFPLPSLVLVATNLALLPIMHPSCLPSLPTRCHCLLLLIANTASHHCHLLIVTFVNHHHCYSLLLLLDATGALMHLLLVCYFTSCRYHFPVVTGHPWQPLSNFIRILTRIMNNTKLLQCIWFVFDHTSLIFLKYIYSN